MQIKLRTLLLALPLFAAACSNTPDQETTTQAETIHVTVGAAQQLTIKPYSQMESDGVTVKWVPGDKIAMWAFNTASTAIMEAHPFTLLHYNTTFSSAKFTADIPAMGEDTYSYYAVTPTPDAVSGTQASYDIPATQNGSDTLAYDVMVAQPITGGALQKGDNSDVVSLSFTHKVHVLKIRIPANDMELPITSLSLRFPVAVTGRLTVDATNPTAPTQFTATEEGKLLTLKFTSPKGAGDTVYAVIAPMELTAVDIIEIKAHSDKKESYPTHMAGKNYRAGHTTPITLTIPELYRYTSINFALPTDGTSTLGEKIENVILTAPEGVDLGEGKNTLTFPANAENKYTFGYEGIFTDNLSKKAFTVTYDSANAQVFGSFTMPTIKEYESNDLNAQLPETAFDIPYLFAENFDSVIDFSNHDEAGGGVNIDTYIDAISLDDKGLTGWSATRSGAEAGNALRICVRTEDAWITTARYHGRADTPPMSGIKAGKSVKVSVSFNYSLNISWSSHAVQLAYGFHTTQGLINSVKSNSTALSNPMAKDIGGSGGSYSNIDQAVTYTIPACTNTHRLVWDVYSKNRKTGNSNGWCYIDNIRVIISK